MTDLITTLVTMLEFGWTTRRIHNKITTEPD